MFASDVATQASFILVAMDKPEYLVQASYV
jgi:hypothetical protein